MGRVFHCPDRHEQVRSQHRYRESPFPFDDASPKFVKRDPDIRYDAYTRYENFIHRLRLTAMAREAMSMKSEIVSIFDSGLLALKSMSTL